MTHLATECIHGLRMDEEWCADCGALTEHLGWVPGAPFPRIVSPEFLHCEDCEATGGGRIGLVCRVACNDCYGDDETGDPVWCPGCQFCCGC